MPPATVALFCICIAFVPLLALGGVAGYLFRPLAMAVVFAMIASYILTYTLVPTMAHFLLAQSASSRGAAAVRPSRRRVGVFRPPSARVRGLFRAVSAGLSRPVAIGARAPFRLRRRLRLRRPAVSWPRPVSWAGLFPLGRFRRDQDPHERPDRERESRKRPLLADQVEQKIRTIIPPDRLASIVDNIGLPISGINLSYSNSGTIGVFDADILVSLREGATPTDAYVKTLREQLPRAFPGTTFSFLPADIVSQILNFGSPAPIDVQIAGNDLNASRAFADQAPGEDPPCSRDRRSAHPGSVPGPGAQGRLQPRTRRRRGAHRKRRLDQPSDDLVRQHPDRADLLAQPRQRRFLRRFGPDPAIWHRYAWRPEKPAADGPPNSTQLLAGSRPFRPSRSTRSSRIMTSATSSNIYATTQDRDLGGVAADIQKIVDDFARRASRRDRPSRSAARWRRWRAPTSSC